MAEQSIRVTSLVKEMMEFDVPFDDVIESLSEYPIPDRFNYISQIINALSDDYRVGVDRLEERHLDIIINWCERTALKMKQLKNKD